MTPELCSSLIVDCEAKSLRRGSLFDQSSCVEVLLVDKLDEMLVGHPWAPGHLSVRDSLRPPREEGYVLENFGSCVKTSERFRANACEL